MSEIWEEGKPFSSIGNKDIGVLVLQGFTGTVGSIIYLAKFLAVQGYHVEAPRLSGHATKWEDLNKVKYSDWLNDVEIAYKKLQERTKNIFVAGLSMGGALTLYMLERHPEIKGGALINHIVVLNDPKVKLLPILSIFVKSMPAISSDIKDPTVKEPAYDRTPTRGAYEMVKLLNIVQKDLKKITQPLLILKSREDHVVPLENVDYTLNNVSSKDVKVIYLENSYHVATMDYDKDLINNYVKEFIETYL
ncbi:alpha/beta hydrolase [Caldisericum exile]|uniref:Esterase n=1 Tax=Caldisericum exile (strain DSM 21853 / NBRC 104410 / AZM16c01) TaxID=511051 RepID=A0A7U6GFH8_CALEA|nr:alpha/beta fold hydrolase [Caldisericum exile]BAL81435.1 putative esterase [Caldisericum exile AZM16c01]